MIVSNYTRTALDLLFVNTFPLEELLMCGAALITILCVITKKKQ